MFSFQNRFIIMAFLLALTGLTQAKVTAALDRTEISLGESVNLTISANEVLRETPDFDMLSAVFDVGESARSMATNIVNGSVSSQTTWTVTLVPKSLGQHIIPPIDVGQQQTEALKVSVVKPDPNAQAQGNLFIEFSANESSAFVQQEIILTVKLFYAVGLNRGASLTEPKANGLIVYPINKSIQYTTQRNGKDYQVLERKYAVFAENSGPLQISPVVFQGEIMERSQNNRFGLMRQGRQVRKSSNVLNLTIKQIPAAFVQKDWLPATQLTIEQEWPNNQVYRVGEPITRRIEITAQGLAENQLPDIDAEDFPGARMYQDKSDTITRNNGGHLVASKTISQAIIPNKAGSLEVPGIEIDWFNSETNKAMTARLPTMTLDVKQVATNNTQKPPPKAVNFDAADPESSQISLADDSADKAIHDTPWWFYGTLGFGALWLLTLVLFIIKLKSRPSPQITSRPEIPSPQVSIKNINAMSPRERQSQLIKWWNQQYQQGVTNLSQIQQQLDNPEALKAIEELQNQLYVDADLKSDSNWRKLIKKGYLKPKQNTAELNQVLPDLYN